ncbi:hypothetical protein PVNG_05983 [Plasmodium vivax North Korean]|uniref:Uncharacterized protein n=1 Tax=Plasmodium vivax North Korean TaxID=1035514 RepID=A0A0J9TK09_PLAVI|nr:hypothetical protein PVNG_05983 [Plasmodium vivax North Korean]
MKNFFNYVIFDDVSTYEEYESIAVNGNTYQKYAEFCNSINFGLDQKTQIIRICTKFVKLFKVLYENNKIHGKNHISDKYTEFLNYWLNHQLIENSIDKSYHNELYECLDKCKKNYNNALEKCFQVGDHDVCKVLKIFNVFYESNKKKIFSNYGVIELPILTEFILLGSGSGKSDNQNIGYNLYLNLTQLLSYQYNILFEHDAKKNKNNMMNILQQFFQYCDENRKNEKLSSFMEEFIEQYYNIKKNEYENIFNECNTNGEEYTHCQLFKVCKKNFTNQLKKIVWDTNEYIIKQKKYIESLSPLQLWIFKAQSMFQDFDAMSRISPTIMSTMVAIVVCLFFLYKVLKTIN